MSLFFRIFQHLLPRSQAWRLAIQTTIRAFFQGLANWLELTPVPGLEPPRTFADLILLDLFPNTTRQLEEWEKQFGLPPTTTDSARRAQLAAAWAANGGQSLAYIQRVLQTAGFNVYLHEWWSAGPPYVARDPRAYTTRPLRGTTRCSAFSSGPRCTKGPPSEFRCNAFLGNDPHYIVNKDLTKRAPPPIPDDPIFWPFFFYVGGPNFPDHASVDPARRDEFERLLLKLRPSQHWIVLLINYDGGVFDNTFDNTFE